jgi:hypothetical protein
MRALNCDLRLLAKKVHLLMASFARVSVRRMTKFSGALLSR